MLPATQKVSLALLSLMLLLLPGALSGQKERPRPVTDELKLFSEKAIGEAGAIIAKIKDKHRKDLRIETMEKGPAVKDARKSALERAKSLGVDGIYILITLKPQHFEVVVSPKTAALFTNGDRDEVVKVLKEKLGRSNDEALLTIANYALETMNKRAKPADGFSQLVGEWLGPPVEVTVKATGATDFNAKGQLYLRFSEIRGKLYIDLGYVAQTEKKVSIGLFRNCDFELKEAGGDRQIVIRNAGNGAGSVVLTYDLGDDTLKIKSSGKLAVPDVPAPADPSGEWKRMASK